MAGIILLKTALGQVGTMPGKVKKTSQKLKIHLSPTKREVIWCLTLMKVKLKNKKIPIIKLSTQL